MARKHYRAVQKNIECQERQREQFYKVDAYKNIAILLFVALAAFLKGLIFGYLKGKKK